MTNLDSLLKSRGVILLTKVHIVKAMVFLVVIYGCETWTIKKGRVPKNWFLWTVVLEKTLESSVVCEEIKSVNPKGNQLNIHWKDWCWSFSFNTLATWYEEPTHWKRLMLGKIEGRRRRGQDGWITSQTQWTWIWATPDGEGQGSLVCCSPWGHKESDMT